MGEAELLIAGLLVAVAGLSALARRLSVLYPIVLVVGGALLGFVPGLPEVKLDPEVVLLVFLPPLLYSEAIFANFGDFRANLRALTLSAVGLVLATMCVVAWAAHALIPGLPWAAAFGHRIFRPADDENYVVLDLEFESEGEAEAYLDWLRREVWSSREASPALAGGPQTRIAKVMETRQY
jgi:Sodium/hydrogen exchanger family